MKIRPASFAAFVSVLGLLTWLAVTDAGRTRTSPSPAGEAGPSDWENRSSDGSALPCQLPLVWRLARLDAEFGIDTALATAALREAAEIWEAAVGRSLFLHDPRSGFPVRFVYDERQVGTQEKDRLQPDFEETRRALDETRRSLEALDAEGRVTERSVGERDEARRLLLNEEDRLRLRVQELEERADSLSRRFPVEAREAALYREAVRVGNGRVADVSREIRIFRFADLDDLRLVVAHELGHALGLGHVTDAASFMWEGPSAGQPDVRSPTVQEEDVARLRSLCADL